MHNQHPFSSPPPPSVELPLSSDELRHSLLCTTLELESTRLFAREELLRLESYALRLSRLLHIAACERDEARLLLLLHRRRHLSPATSSSDGENSPAEEMEAAAVRRRLPEKGRFLEAVMTAGPLLETLMLAGPLPEWRQPPPTMQEFEIPAVVVGGGGWGWSGESPEMGEEN